MSDELSPEMLEEAAPDLLTLEDEDGKEVTFEVIDATEVNGTRYMDIVDDDEELITVGKVFEERLRAMYDIDDSELQ